MKKVLFPQRQYIERYGFQNFIITRIYHENILNLKNIYIKTDKYRGEMLTN